MLSRLVLIAAIAAAAVDAAAQEPRFRYPAPPAGTVDVKKDVAYATADGVRLLMDVFRPTKTSEATSPQRCV